MAVTHEATDSRRHTFRRGPGSMYIFPIRHPYGGYMASHISGGHDGRNSSISEIGRIYQTIKDYPLTTGYLLAVLATFLIMVVVW